ncbi:PREDICTED: uncharacterized protein LOC105360373 [Ceratosolen solmsi marchali]|uniref:Uncharacterized protein LOC105360373 n=1 Tax=Ceratosolen solmsi marchali TaxID=326594 RepID=A0AAJ6VMP0_9HYME|nr:PREDICTED: uncharacterized protein LOC105360373 [Ceratosolen solmsi marchali]
MIKLNFDNPRPVENHLCTAALISTQHVLSAATCTNDRLSNETLILLGDRNLNNCNIYSILWWINYDAWSEFKRVPRLYFVNDISISKLLRPVEHDIVPGVLLYMPNENLEASSAQVAAWGANNHHIITPYMLTSTVRFLSNSKCQSKLTKLEKSFVLVHERFFCTNAHPYVILFRGDFGGPLIYRNRIIGINKETLPQMDGNFHPSKINIHTSIFPYRQFIEDVTSIEYNLKSVNAIIGNNVRQVNTGEFKFIVSLMKINRANSIPNEAHYCTGSLITRKDVLSCAHCLDEEELESSQVLIGSSDLRFGEMLYIYWWITYDQWGDSGGPLLSMGMVIGVNTATVPVTVKVPHPDKVNVHAGIEYYRAFILEAIGSSFVWS